MHPGKESHQELKMSDCRTLVLAGLAGAVSLAAFATPAFAQAEGAPSSEVKASSDSQTTATATNVSDTIIVTGTRQTAQTQFTALSPVDVFSKKTIQSTVTSNLDETLTQLVPSFNVKHLPASDGPEFIRPAALDGLTPDMTLLLVNGKRFHLSAFLQSNGSQAADLGQIPSFDIGHVEVLRDGASAQYGSDAIAGVINVILDTSPGFSAYAQGSQYYEGDGAALQVGGRAGFALKGGGHFVFTAQYATSGSTSRSIQRPDAIAFQAANPDIKVPNPVQDWGNPLTRSLKFAVDAAEPIGDNMELYTFGTYGHSYGIADINWRNPAANPNIYNTTPIFPGFNLSNIYPAGFTPQEGIHADDGQVVGGIRSTGTSRFSWDLSTSFGINSTAFFLDHSINASLGPDSPFNFYLGRQIQREFNINADGVYRLPISLLDDPVNIAFGAERRVQTYRVAEGDPASFAVGPGAAAGLSSQSNGFPGFGPQQAGTWNQTDYAGYLDITVPLTKRWNVEVALRDESYDTFGNTFNYKFATRYEITPSIAIRGAFSTGFKAPTPAQLNSTSINQSLDTKTLQLFTTGRLSPLNPVSAFFGAKPLTPEEAKTYTAGLVWHTDNGLSGSLDAYQIDVSKRFSVSQTFVVTPDIRAQLVALGVEGANEFSNVNFYTNDFNTRTRGIDAVLSYTRKVGPGTLNATAAYSYTQTHVTSGSLAAASDELQRVTFEQGIPDHNATGTLTYDVGKFSLLGRLRYYGPWTDSSGNAVGNIFQKFGGVFFFDASVSYKLTNQFTIRVGAENLFNTYPDKATNQANRGLLYSRQSPYDTNGGNYYARVDFKF
jgi:iron complex outermembrane receptor protein